MQISDLAKLCTKVPQDKSSSWFPPVLLAPREKDPQG